MPPYRASLGGIEGSGVYMTPSHAVDYGGIIRAISDTASSAIQNAYLRRMAQQNQALAKQREEREAQAQKDALDLKRHELQLQKLRYGVVPEHDETDEQGNTVRVPERYDPTKAEGYVRETSVAKIRTDAAAEAKKAEHVAAMQRLERQAELRGQQQTEHDKRVLGARAQMLQRGLTANGLEAWRRSMADGVISQLDGDLEGAYDFLANDEMGKKFGVKGLTAEDLYAAAGRYRNVEARAGNSLLNSASPGRAVQKVQQVRKLLTPNAAGAAGAPASAPPSGVTPPAGGNMSIKSLSRPLPSPAGAPGVAPSAAPAAAQPKPLGKAPGAATPTETITAAERDALKGMGWTDAQIGARYKVQTPNEEE